MRPSFVLTSKLKTIGDFASRLPDDPLFIGARGADATTGFCSSD